MTTTTIKTGLRVAIFGGMLGLMPGVAWADNATDPRGAATSPNVPDHAAAEARGAGPDFSSSQANGDTNNSSTGATSDAADHRTYEAQAAGILDLSAGTTSTVPDHASAQKRSASPDLPRT